jgi:alanine racemase
LTQTLPNSAIWNDITEAPTLNEASPDALKPSAHVSLPVIQANYAALDQFTGSSETAAVVKADCYGHGVRHVAPALAQAGCRTYFVAYLSEGLVLRETLGPDAEIFVFNGVSDAELSTFEAARLSPVCNDAHQVRLCVSKRFSGQYAIHFDTGMNRLGVRLEASEEMATLAASRPPVLVMSHLACADLTEHEMNVSQLKQFRDLTALFPDSRKSLSATAGIYLGEAYHFDMVRPGIGLYGGGPARPPHLRLTTAMTLTAPVLSVFTASAGESVGYGASHLVRKDAVLATVALGYADGFLRAAGNFGFAVLKDVPCPIVGRVSMDLITLDVSDLPEPPAIGDRAEFIGRKAGYEIQAEAMGTIGYELTSRLGPRMSRSWGQ